MITEHNVGGIDLNAKSLVLDINKEGADGTFHIDPALLAEFRRGDFAGITPNILSITPMASPYEIMGMAQNYQNLSK